MLGGLLSRGTSLCREPESSLRGGGLVSASLAAVVPTSISSGPWGWAEGDGAGPRPLQVLGTRRPSGPTPQGQAASGRWNWYPPCLHLCGCWERTREEGWWAQEAYHFTSPRASMPHVRHLGEHCPRPKVKQEKISRPKSERHSSC